MAKKLKFKKIKGFLIDLDGVIYQDDQLIPGAKEFVTLLDKNNIPFRFITNSSLKTEDEISGKLNKMGLDVKSEYIFSALTSAKHYVKNKKYKNGKALLPEKSAKYFRYNPDKKIDCVLDGDLGEAFQFDILNSSFKLLMSGADLLAVHKNRFWKVDNELRLDAGGFVKLLEYASGKKAEIIGKPSAIFFNQVINDIKIKPKNLAMIGDDMETDILGAAKQNISTILVKTGKTDKKLLKKFSVKPDVVVDSVASLISHIK